jgi:acyl dehydratase
MSASGAVIEDLRSLKNFLGREVVVTEWLEVTQERINKFAEVTEDQQWIHVDLERARKESPYGTTIGHGFLTLSLLSRFLGEAIHVRGNVRMSVNYGLNRVRFPAPVPAGSRIRARFALVGWKEAPEHADVTYAITMEIESAEKPCCVAEWVVRYYF